MKLISLRQVTRLMLKLEKSGFFAGGITMLEETLILLEMLQVFMDFWQRIYDKCSQYTGSLLRTTSKSLLLARNKTIL